MDQFVVSFRKYRPDTFSSVIGQAHITDTLKNAIKGNQLAQAFLFCGPRGVGKTTCARILAKAVNCTQLTPKGDPCNTCDSCSAFNTGRSISIHELDAASNNSVDDIRNLIEQVRFVPAGGAKAVYIVDEVHMLSSSAFNAFLKTLEEPPRHAIFILATTEKNKILPTILSRCQKFDFRRIKIQDMALHLADIAQKEDIAFEMPALQLIALKADGALRDALSYFDQVSTYSSRNITFEAALENLNILDYDYYFKIQDAITRRSHADALLIFQEILNKGFDAYNFISGLLQHYRNLLMAAEPKTMELLQTSDNVRNKYLKSAASLNESFLLNAFQLCSDAEVKYRDTANPSLLIELLLIKLVYLEDAIVLAGNMNADPHGGADEKKKSDARSEVNTSASTFDAVADAPQAVTQPVDAIAQTATTKDIQVQSKPSQSNARSVEMPASFSRNAIIPKDLHDLDSHHHLPKANQQDIDEDNAAHKNPVATEAFQTAYHKLMGALELDHKMALAAELKRNQWELDVCKWIQKINNPATKIIFEEHRHYLVEFMRSELNHQGIRLELQMEEASAEDDKPPVFANSEGRLRRMETLYPWLSEFIRKHNANIAYN
jgi:DNA polymerase-3 subunit gamma/tau